MIYKELADIGRLLEDKSIIESYPDKTEYTFHELLIASMPSKKRKKEDGEIGIVEIPLDGRQADIYSTVTQETLKEMGVIKPAGGNEISYLLADRLRGFGFNKKMECRLVRNIEEYRAILNKKGFLQKLNSQLDSANKITEEEFGEFKKLIELIDIDQIPAIIKEAIEKHGEDFYGYLTVNGTVLSLTRFYKHYAVWRKTGGGIQKKKAENKEKKALCSVCGQLKNDVCADNMKSVKSVKFFTSTDQNYASGLCNFDRQFKICKDCLEQLILFSAKMDDFTGWFVGQTALIYPSFVFTEGIDREDFVDLSKNIKDRVVSLEKRDNLLDKIKQLAKSIDREMESGNNYLINIILFAKDKASTKVINQIKDIPPLRLGIIYKNISEITRLCIQQGFNDGDNVISFLDIKSFLVSKIGDKPSYKKYIAFAKAVLEDTVLSREFFTVPMAARTYRSVIDDKKKKPHWSNWKKFMLRYGIWLMCLENIGTIKPYGGDQGLLYKELQEKSVNAKPKSDVSIVAKYAAECNLKNDERLALFILGYLTEKISAIQWSNNKGTLMDRLIMKDLSLKKAKKINARLMEAIQVSYKENALEFDKVLVQMVNRILGMADKMETSTSEALIMFYWGAAFYKNTRDLRDTKKQSVS